MTLCSAAFFLWAPSIMGSQNAFEGYTFVFSGTNAYLYNMDKTIVHQWSNLRSNSAGCADLLRDSSILWPSSDRGSWTQQGALQGGRLQIIKWDGTVTWDYLYRSADYMPHHDIEPVYYTNNPREKPNVLVICYTTWGDKITELKPTGLNTAEVVWEWWAGDHNCQAGTGIGKPELLDKGEGGIGSFRGDFDIMHTNCVSFNRTLNQLVLSVKGFNEMMVIDHSTTTAEARGHTGGKYGKGGDILYRWGMPSNYGVTGTQQIRGQHGSCWVQDTMPGTSLPIPGAFNMMCVDNGNRRVVEIVPAGAKNGVYPRTDGQAFAPSAALWTHAVSDLQGNEGSVQRLPNGNTLICIGGVSMGGIGGSRGRVFELTPAGAVVWDLSGIPTTTEGVRYAYSYLDGSQTYVQRKPVYSAGQRLSIVSDPLSGQVRIVTAQPLHGARVSLFTLGGRSVVDGYPLQNSVLNLGRRPAGQYFVKICSGNTVSWERVAVRQ
ncbi:MAG: T9SS type A sorting domain-containing protein [Chitinispirillaceae bacterium]|nr:T9SS type A sorting domain-containing protein [Chitinispirillaceae bacterium]